MTGARLLTDDKIQISDCTGGRIGDAVRYCQSEQRYKVPIRSNYDRRLTLDKTNTIFKQWI